MYNITSCTQQETSNTYEPNQQTTTTEHQVPERGTKDTKGTVKLINRK